VTNKRDQSSTHSKNEGGKKIKKKVKILSKSKAEPAPIEITVRNVGKQRGGEGPENFKAGVNKGVVAPQKVRE